VRIQRGRGRSCGVVMDGPRFMNTIFAGGIQHAEIISVPDRMVGLSKRCVYITIIIILYYYYISCLACEENELL